MRSPPLQSQLFISRWTKSQPYSSRFFSKPSLSLRQVATHITHNWSHALKFCCCWRWLGWVELWRWPWARRCTSPRPTCLKLVASSPGLRAHRIYGMPSVLWMNCCCCGHCVVLCNWEWWDWWGESEWKHTEERFSSVATLGGCVDLKCIISLRYVGMHKYVWVM